MTVDASPLGGFATQFFDNNGVILSGGKVYTYVAGTTTPQATYTSVSGVTPHANPIILDSAGRVPGGEIWLTSGASYKFVIETSLGVLLGSYDNVATATASSSILIPSGYTTATTVQEAFDDLGSNTGAGYVGFIQTGTGAVSRSALAKSRDVLCIKDFGAVGDGVADDTAAMTAGIVAALAQRRALYLPGGIYKITSVITVTMPNPASGTQATNFFAQLTMYGDGFADTEVRCTSNGFLSIVGSSQQHSIDFQNFAVTATAVNNGTAISMNCTIYPFFGEFTAKSRINLHFRGSDGINNVFYWTVAVESVDWSNIDFSGSMFDGASTPAGTGVITRATAHSMPFVCVFDFIGCHFRFLSVGYNYGTGSQSANFDACFFALCVTQVFAPAGGINHQGLSITNCESYELATGDGVYLACECPNFIFTGNRWAVSAGFRAVALDVAGQFTITNNQFFPDSAVNTATSAIDIDGTVAGTNGIIDGNNFASTTIGIRLKSGSANVLVGPNNKCTSNMTLVTNAGGTDHNIGGQIATPIGAIGYTRGAGNSVTQLTSKSTAVTINNPCGQIVTSNAALAGNTEVSFTVNNTTVDVYDAIVVTTGNAAHQVRVGDNAFTSFKIYVKNITGGSLSDALTINFAVIKSFIV